MHQSIFDQSKMRMLLDIIPVILQLQLYYYYYYYYVHVVVQI